MVGLARMFVVEWELGFGSTFTTNGTEEAERAGSQDTNGDETH